MALVYKFKKEKLLNGSYAHRPRILVILHGKNTSIEVPALIDSGCDTTVVPEGIAKALGLEMHGEKHKLYAYREANDVIVSSVEITFVGRGNRESLKLAKVPVLIALSRQGMEEEDDLILGVHGIFDAFDITFKKSSNQIILKKAILNKTYK